MSNATTEQTAAIQAASLEVLLGLTNKTLESFQKLIDLNLQTTKSILAETQKTARQVLIVKDWPELLALQASLIKPTTDQFMAYRRQFFGIASAMQADFTKIAQAQYEAYRRSVQELVDHSARNAPNGSDGSVAVWQSALAASDTVLETMQQSIKQAVELAESNFNLAAQSTSSAAQRATEQAARTVKH